MVTKISRCIVYVDELSIIGDCMNFTVGKAAYFKVEKAKKGYQNLFSYDYFVNQPSFGDRNRLRGLVTSIKAVFVDKYADDTNDAMCSNNTFSIFDATYVDMFEDKGNYQGRKPRDVKFYLLVMEDCIIFPPFAKYIDKGLKIKKIEFDAEGGTNELFWKVGGNVIGDINGIKLSAKEYYSFVDMPWHSKLIEWTNNFTEHICSGYNQWSNKEWLCWWLSGWILAKEIINSLPPNIVLYYSGVEACREVLEQTTDGEYGLNTMGI